MPDDAMKVRQDVFVTEQGFYDEFDDVDAVAVHLVLYDNNGCPIGTCRVFENGTPGSFTLGRLAVMKDYRGKHLGAYILSAAEEHIRSLSGREIILHAQCQAEQFYYKSGYLPFGDIEDEQGCLHIWMRKTLSGVVNK